MNGLQAVPCVGLLAAATPNAAYLLREDFHLHAALHHLAVARMGEAALDADHHGLLHLVAHHDPETRLARVARRRGGLVAVRHAFGHSGSILALAA